MSGVKRMNRIIGMSVTLFLVGCGARGIKPVDIFPEDACSNCRMAFSDHRFASEIIDDNGEAFKFDDIGCMLAFRTKRTDVNIAATFMKDYETKEWIPYERAVIVETDIDTPMGSGKLAFSDSAKAREFQRQHPSNATVTAKDGSGRECCADEKD